LTLLVRDSLFKSVDYDIMTSILTLLDADFFENLWKTKLTSLLTLLEEVPYKRSHQLNWTILHSAGRLFFVFVILYSIHYLYSISVQYTTCVQYFYTVNFDCTVSLYSILDFCFNTPGTNLIEWLQYFITIWLCLTLLDLEY